MQRILFFILLLCGSTFLSGQDHYAWAFKTNQYDRSSDFSDGLAIIQKGFKRGYITREGQVHLAPKFNIIDAYAEEVASAGYTDFKTMDSRSGYIDRAGGWVIEPQYEVTSPFQEGMACVRLNKLWGFINRSGTLVIPAKFTEASTFSNGLAPVQYQEKWGIINPRGEWVVEPKLEYILAEAEGLFCVKIRDKWGYIRPDGQLAIPPIYNYASSFSDGLAKVEKDGKYGFINAKGEFVISPKFDMVYSFSHQLACAQQGDLWGFIDRTGQFVIAPQFEQASSFSEQLARIKQNGQWGYISTKGKIAIPPAFDSAYDFCEGLARVQQGDQKGYIRYTPPTDEELIIDQPKANPLELTRREIKTGHHIQLRSSRFTIKVFDHNKIDGDIVSMNYNGRWLLKGYTLKEEAKAIVLNLDPNIGENYLLFYADDLGKNPPNTAAIVIDDGSEEQRVILNADLNQCDIIYFEQK